MRAHHTLAHRSPKPALNFSKAIRNESVIIFANRLIETANQTHWNPVPHVLEALKSRDFAWLYTPRTGRILWQLLIFPITGREAAMLEKLEFMIALSREQHFG